MKKTSGFFKFVNFLILSLKQNLNAFRDTKVPDSKLVRKEVNINMRTLHKFIKFLFNDVLVRKKCMYSFTVKGNRNRHTLWDETFYKRCFYIFQDSICLTAPMFCVGQCKHCSIRDSRACARQKRYMGQLT